MNLTIATREELRRAYETVLTEAFPPEELKPLSAMERLLDAERYLPLLLKEDGTLLGLIFLWLGRDNYWIVDHLAVPAAGRNRGIGGILIQMTREKYPDVVLLGESEAPTGDPARDELILRRLGFYDRNHAQILSYDTAAFGVHYKTLAWSNRPIDEAAALAHHQEIYRDSFTPELYERFIQIPYVPGEPLKEASRWRQSDEDDG